jgi:hypothetical protein
LDVSERFHIFAIENRDGLEIIEGDLLPFAEKTANHDKVLVYARA